MAGKTIGISLIHYTGENRRLNALRWKQVTINAPISFHSKVTRCALPARIWTHNAIQPNPLGM